MAKNEKSGFLGFVLLICVVSIVFINAPGMIVLGFVKTNMVKNMDISQVWVFSCVVSVAVFVLVFAAIREFKAALVAYLVICFVSVGVCTVSYFGFKQKFPERYLNYYFDGKSYVPVK